MTFVGNLPMSTLYVGSQQASRIYVGDIMAWQPYAGDGSMEMVEYTGTGATNRTQTGLPWAPGLVFFTNNANPSTYPRYWLDTLSASKPSYWAMSGLTPLSYGFTGFTGDGWISSSSTFNANSKAYQVFVWPKGDATLQTNTLGSLTASQYANDQAGWSAGTYFGNGLSGATFGHGLSTAPSMVIIWADTDPYTNPRLWGDGYGSRVLGTWSEPAGEYGNNGILTVDENTITIDDIHAVNELGAECSYVCFADKPGMTASGVINGDGVNPVIVNTGFEPRLIILIGTDGTTDKLGPYGYTARTGQTAPYFANYRTLGNSYSTPDPQPISDKVQMLADGFQVNAVNRGNNGTTPAFWIAFK